MSKRSKARACDVCHTVGPEATIQLCLRRTGKPQDRVMGTAPQVCQLMRGLETAERESFYALHLNARNEIVDIDKVAVGHQSGVEVYPKEVFRAAMLSGAEQLIFVHNHPSGNDTPSRQDIELTKRLREVGELVGIKVLDHIVVGYNHVDGSPLCSSMSAKGFLGDQHDYPLLANQLQKKRKK